MTLLEEGRLCIKKLGRDAGDRAVVTEVVDANFVKIISSSRLKERRCNVRHLEFLSEKIDPKSHEQVAKALEIDISKLSKTPKAATQAHHKKS